MKVIKNIKKKTEQFSEDSLEYKAREEVFKESEEKYKILAESSGEGMFLANRQGFLTYINPALEKMFKINASEAVGTHFTKYLTKISALKSIKLFFELLKGKPFKLLEFEAVNTKKQVFPIDVSASPIIKKEKIEGMVCIIRDITERKHNEEKFKTLAEYSPNMIFINFKNKIVYANKKCEDVMGYKRSELYLSNFDFLNLIAPESRELIKSSFTKHMRGEAVTPYEQTVITKDGKRIEVVLSTTLIDYEDGKAILGILTDITERKKADEELRESEAKYKALFVNAAEGIVVADLQTKQFSYANPAVCRMFGYTEEEFLRVGVMDIHPKESLDHVLAEFEAQVRGEKTLAPDLPCLRKDGTLFFANVSAVATVLGGRKCNVGFFTDVTERKRIEEMLQESEKKFRNLFESSRDAIMTLEPPSWKFTSGNQATVEMFGAMNAEEFSNLGPWDVSPERQPDGRDSAEKAKEMIEKAMREGFNFFEWTHKRLNGANFPATVLLTRTEQGGKKILQATVRDISGQKKAEAAVVEEKNKLEKYLNVAGAIILFLSPDRKIILINRRGREILGYEPKDTLNKDWFTDFIPEKDRAKAIATFDGLIEGKTDEIKYFETHVLTKNKNQMNIGWGSIVIKDILGKRQAVLSTGIDITELEQAKTTISQLSEVNKLKDDFLNIATHELKTPLTTIIGLSEIMKGQSSSLNPESQKYINIINAEGRKLNHIIKRVLTVTRFESGREIIAEEKINLKELIFSFLPSLEVVTKKKDLKIAIDIKDENINLISDKEKISEVIYNFVDNAVKHSSAGQTITISVSRFSPKFAKIEVIDRGEGIPKKLQSKLFAKFSQVDSSLSRSQEGTGLGLYICKLIAEKLGGEIGVKSALGKGSSFFFTLPVAA